MEILVVFIVLVGLLGFYPHFVTNHLAHPKQTLDSISSWIGSNW